MNWSIALVPQTPFVGGNCIFLGGTKDQCCSHFAPCETHKSSVFTSCGLKDKFDSIGGMWSSSLEMTRAIKSLISGWPATITPATPDSVSNRRSDSRASSSGPWQRKQRSESIGFTSRLKSTSASPCKANSD